MAAIDLAFPCADAGPTSCWQATPYSITAAGRDLRRAARVRCLFAPLNPIFSMSDLEFCVLEQPIRPNRCNVNYWPGNYAQPKTKQGIDMPIEKALLEQAVEKLADKADQCLELGKAEHKIADTQHANAERLVVLGVSLEAVAVALSGELEMIASRTSPPLVEQAGEPRPGSPSAPSDRATSAAPASRPTLLPFIRARA